MYFFMILLAIVGILFLYACRSDKGPNTHYYRGKASPPKAIQSLIHWLTRRAI